MLTKTELTPERKLLLAMILQQRQAAFDAANEAASRQVTTLKRALGIEGRVTVLEDELELIYDDGCDSDVAVVLDHSVDSAESDAAGGSVPALAGVSACPQGDGDSGEG